MFAVGVLLWELWHGRLVGRLPEGLRVPGEALPFAGLPPRRAAEFGEGSLDRDFLASTSGQNSAAQDPPPAPPPLRAVLGACCGPTAGARPSIAEALHAFESDVTVAALKVAASLSPPAGEDGDDKEVGDLDEMGDFFAAAGLGDGPEGSGGADPLMRALLRASGLGRYESELVDLGFTDVEMLGDRELLDDATLLDQLKMSKLDVRRLRAALSQRMRSGGLAAAMSGAGATSASRDRWHALEKELASVGTGI